MGSLSTNDSALFTRLEDARKLEGQYLGLLRHGWPCEDCVHSHYDLSGHKQMLWNWRNVYLRIPRLRKFTIPAWLQIRIMDELRVS